jgi:hypothetical protein
VSKTQELTQESSREEQLARLSSEQHAIKDRLRELDQPALSSAERVEREQLRQRRHETLDRLLRLQNH